MLDRSILTLFKTFMFHPTLLHQQHWTMWDSFEQAIAIRFWCVCVCVCVGGGGGCAPPIFFYVRMLVKITSKVGQNKKDLFPCRKI